MAPGRDWTHQVGAADRAGSTNSSVRRGPTRSPGGSVNRAGGTALPPGSVRPSGSPHGRVGGSRDAHEWLERLDRGERVVVNLPPETDPDGVRRVRPTPCAPGAGPHHRRLGRSAPVPANCRGDAAQREDAEARRVRHRRRLAEPDPPPKRLSVQEERAALWDALGLPPHKRGR